MVGLHTELVLQTRERCLGLLLQSLLVERVATNTRVAQQIALGGRSGGLGAIVLVSV